MLCVLRKGAGLKAGATMRRKVRWNIEVAKFQGCEAANLRDVGPATQIHVLST
jgi:hypothetical protein